MNIYAIPPLITDFLILIIGILVYLGKPYARTNQIFCLFCLSMVIWLSGYSLMYLSGNGISALTWARFGFIGISFIPILAYHFIAEFIEKPPSKMVLFFLYMFATISVLFGQSKLVYQGIANYFWGYYPSAGPIYFLFLSAFIVLFGHGTFILFINYINLLKLNQKIRAKQVLYVLIAFAGGTTGLVDYVIKYGIEIYPFGYIAALFFISMIAYAIMQYRLLDIEIIIKRTALYSLLTAILTGIFIAFILVGQNLFTGLTGNNSLWASVIGAFVIALVFSPLREAVQWLVDLLFFRARYDYQRLLGRYSIALKRPMADLDRFSTLAPYLLTRYMKLTGASILVLNRNSQAYEMRAADGDARTLLGVALPLDSPLILELINSEKEITNEKIKEILKHPAISVNEKEQYSQIAAEMERLKTTLIIPCISESEYFKKPTLIATINLGKKKSDEPFSREDLTFLTTLANQSIIGIEYAFIIEELKKNQERTVNSEKLAALGTTTAGIAHELKNPLTYLNTVAQLFPQKWEDPAFRQNINEMFFPEVQRMQLIVEGLLAYSRENPLLLQPTDVQAVIEKTLAILIFEIRKTKVAVKTNYQHHGAQAMGDANRLVQVFMNIISNAVQAMADHGGELIITTEVDANNYKIFIKDSGPGITRENQKRLFDPFFTTKETGTGLGLAISKKIVNEHHGAIMVNSFPGCGTVFTIHLPKAG